MPSMKFCHEHAGSVICSDAKCTHCGWNGKEADDRKEFIREYGLCRITDVCGDTYFTFCINKENGKYKKPTLKDKEAWEEHNENFNEEKILQEVHDYNLTHGYAK